jgi:hypothetical protein
MATTSRNGKTNYVQAVVASENSSDTVNGTSGRESRDATTSTGATTTVTNGTNTSQGNQQSENSRALTSNSEVQRTSIEKVNIGFEIQFKVPIIGRFPTQPGNNC